MSMYHPTLEAAHEALYATFPLDDPDAHRFIVCDPDDDYYVTGSSLIDIVDTLHVHSEMHDKAYNTYTVYGYVARDLMVPDVAFTPDAAQPKISGIRFSAELLENAAIAWNELRTPPEKPLSHFKSAIVYARNQFEMERVTEVFVVEDTDESDIYYVAHDLADVEAILEREATDGNLSDETVTSGYLIHRISRPENGGPDTWQFAVTSPTIRRRIDVSFP